jgi:hypothetical protein
MSENSGPNRGGRGFSLDNNITETARENRKAKRDADARAAAQAKALAETRKQDKADLAAAKKAAGKVVVAKPTPSPTPNPDPVVTPPPVIVSTPTSEPPGVTPPKDTPVAAKPSPIDVLDPNVYTIYKEEIKRLTLRLVNRAKNLLLAYDFSSIDKITDYQIETDRAARNSNIITTPQVPESPSSSSLTAQDTAVSLINAISNQISDNVPLATKLALFGSDVNGTFTAGKLGISNGIANYDLRFRVDNVSPEIRNIIVRCYEIG